jgi:hypothetical protein
MATEAHLGMADVGGTMHAAKVAREIKRRRLHSLMGPGRNTFEDATNILPATMAAIVTPEHEVTLTLRYLHRTVPDIDERISLLSEILGE